MTAERPMADGTVEKDPDGSTTIGFDRRLRHPVERVWQALTDPDELRRWWGDTKAGAGRGRPVPAALAQHRRARRRRDPGRHHHQHRPATAARDLRPLGLDSRRPARDPHPAHLGARTGRRPHPAPPQEPDPRLRPGRPHRSRLAPAPRRPRHRPRGGDVDIAHPDTLFAPIHQAYTEKYGAGPEPGGDGTPQPTEPDSST
jgi:Activator of Hsp90 ATPase homolog 1-like protein